MKSQRITVKQALEADFKLIKLQYTHLAESFEGMNYDVNGPLGWESIARDFIFTDSNQKANRFIKTIKKHKIEAEKVLRSKIETRVILMRENRLSLLIGKDLARRLKLVINDLQGHSPKHFA